MAWRGASPMRGLPHSDAGASVRPDHGAGAAFAAGPPPGRGSKASPAAAPSGPLCDAPPSRARMGSEAVRRSRAPSCRTSGCGSWLGHRGHWPPGHVGSAASGCLRPPLLLSPPDGWGAAGYRASADCGPQGFVWRAIPGRSSQPLARPRHGRSAGWDGGDVPWIGAWPLPGRWKASLRCPSAPGSLASAVTPWRGLLERSTASLAGNSMPVFPRNRDWPG
jgi:hypothetical protein